MHPPPGPDHPLILLSPCPKTFPSCLQHASCHPLLAPTPPIAILPVPAYLGMGCSSAAKPMWAFTLVHPVFKLLQRHLKVPESIQDAPD